MSLKNVFILKYSLNFMQDSKILLFSEIITQKSINVIRYCLHNKFYFA